MKTYALLFGLLVVTLGGCTNQQEKSGGITDFSRDTALIHQLIRKADRESYEQRDSALATIIKAESLAKKREYLNGLAEARFIHANILYYDNLYGDALREYTDALEMARQNRDTLLMAKCLVQLGSLHLSTDDPNIALKLHYESLPLFEKVGDLKGVAKVYNFLGGYKTDQGAFDTAEYFLEQSLQIHKALGDTIGMIQNRGNLAYLFKVQGDYRRAETVYRKILAELEHSNDLYTKSVMYYNLADLESERGNASVALRHLMKGIDLASLTGDTVMLGSMLGQAGELFIKTGRHDSARWCLRNALVCARAIHDLETEQMILQQQVILDTQSGSFTEAFRRQKSITALGDSIFALRLANNVKTIELKHENEKQQQQVEFQNNVIASHRRGNIILIILLFVSVAFISILVRLLLIQRRYQKQQQELTVREISVKQLELEKMQRHEELQVLKNEKTELDLKAREHELVSIALHVDQVNEFLEGLVRSLRLLNGKSLQESQFAMEGIEKAIRSRIRESGNPDLFNSKFNQLHAHFFERLKENHPELSPYDLKFCAYLRIHLSSHQIAAILNVTQEAIRKTRYRLRKKLGLAPEDSLEEYIATY